MEIYKSSLLKSVTFRSEVLTVMLRSKEREDRLPLKFHKNYNKRFP